MNNLNQIFENVVAVNGVQTADWQYQFDASGNMKQKKNVTTGDTWTYQWDEDDRLTSVAFVGSPNNWTITYSYDYLGRMVSRQDSRDSTASKFAWEGMNCTFEQTPSGMQTRYCIPGNVLRSFDIAGTVYQVHCDDFGSVRLISDNTGALISHFESDAWGNQLSSSNDPLTFNYRFLGAFGVRWDAMTGLYYMRNRWYDPTLGRFLSRDPYGTSLNLYVYCRNNPLLVIDPNGSKSTIVYYRGGAGGYAESPPPSSEWASVYRPVDKKQFATSAFLEGEYRALRDTIKGMKEGDDLYLVGRSQGGGVAYWLWCKHGQDLRALKNIRIHIVTVGTGGQPVERLANTKELRKGKWVSLLDLDECKERCKSRQPDTWDAFWSSEGENNGTKGDYTDALRPGGPNTQKNVRELMPGANLHDFGYEIWHGSWGHDGFQWWKYIQ